MFSIVAIFIVLLLVFYVVFETLENIFLDILATMEPVMQSIYWNESRLRHINSSGRGWTLTENSNDLRSCILMKIQTLYECDNFL